MPGMYFIGVEFPPDGTSPAAGLAFMQYDGKSASLKEYTTLFHLDDISLWILDRCRFLGIVAVNVPCLSPHEKIPLQPAEKQLAEALMPFCPSKSPFPTSVLKSSLRLKELLRRLSDWEFDPDPFFPSRTLIRAQLEVSSQASQVAFFQLSTFLTPTQGNARQRAKGIQQFQRQILEKLPQQDPPVLANATLLSLSVIPTIGKRSTMGESLERILNAVLSAYTGLYYWWWGTSRCQVYGTSREGYIVAPVLPKPS